MKKHYNLGPDPKLKHRAQMGETTLHKVDKIILPRSNNYTIIRKKTLAAHPLPRHSQASTPLANVSLLYERTDNFFWIANLV